MRASPESRFGVRGVDVYRRQRRLATGRTTAGRTSQPSIRRWHFDGRQSPSADAAANYRAPAIQKLILSSATTQPRAKRIRRDLSADRPGSVRPPHPPAPVCSNRPHNPYVLRYTHPLPSDSRIAVTRRLATRRIKTASNGRVFEELTIVTSGPRKGHGHRPSTMVRQIMRFKTFNTIKVTFYRCSKDEHIVHGYRSQRNDAAGAVSRRISL